MNFQQMLNNSNSLVSSYDSTDKSDEYNVCNTYMWKCMFYADNEFYRDKLGNDADIS